MQATPATVTLTIDDRQVQAVAGETVLDAARRAGIPIQTLCDVPGLSAWAGCRLCLVEVSDWGRWVPACGAPVRAGMVVSTNTDELRGHRRSVVEALLAEGNHICAVCVTNGHCELQDAAAEAGVDHVEPGYRWPLLPVDASHPRFVFDPNRCILCTRCVRTCAEVEGAHVWDINFRGARSELVADGGIPWGESLSCTSCGKCVEECPTGALFVKGATAGEMRHHPELVGELTAKRRAHAAAETAP
jgi:bidirectional [NiFe] hydrogenase diaphorase subunit